MMDLTKTVSLLLILVIMTIGVYLMHGVVVAGLAALTFVLGYRFAVNKVIGWKWAEFIAAGIIWVVIVSLMGLLITPEAGFIIGDVIIIVAYLNS